MGGMMGSSQSMQPDPNQFQQQSYQMPGQMNGMNPMGGMNQMQPGMQMQGPESQISAEVLQAERQMQELQEQIQKLQSGGGPGPMQEGLGGGFNAAGPPMSQTNQGGWDDESDSGSENDWWNQPSPYQV